MAGNCGGKYEHFRLVMKSEFNLRAEANEPKWVKQLECLLCVKHGEIFAKITTNEFKKYSGTVGMGENE